MNVVSIKNHMFRAGGGIQSHSELISDLGELKNDWMKLHLEVCYSFVFPETSS